MQQMDRLRLDWMTLYRLELEQLPVHPLARPHCLDPVLQLSLGLLVWLASHHRPWLGQVPRH